MKAFLKIFNKANGTKLRNFIRIVVVAASAYGFKLNGKDMAAILLPLEGVLGGLTASNIGETPAS